MEAVKTKFIELDKHEDEIKHVKTVDPNGEYQYQPKLDILINCAGVIYPGDLDNSFPNDHDYLMDVNLRAPYVLINFF